MSDDDFNDGDDNNSNSGKGLRAQLEAALNERKELAERLAKFEAAQRKSTVAEILTAKGIPASAASLYNGEDVSEDAVGKWLEAHADVFKPTATPDESTSEGADASDPNEDAAKRAIAAAFGLPSPVETKPGTKVVVNPEEKLRLMRTLPYEELVKRGWIPEPKGYGPRR